MRGLKEFFRMIITAVVCFGTKLFGENKKEFVKVCTENGSTFFLKSKELSATRNNNVNVYYHNSSHPLFLKKVMPWKQGPGDRNRQLHKNRSPSRAEILEEIRDGGIYLVPE